MRILIVKISAMGDILHALPVLDYLHQALPGCEIDWVVEEAFADLLRHNPLISRLHAVRFKAWKRAPFATGTIREIMAVRTALVERCYDLVLDIQGNIKSGIVTGLTGCRQRVGFVRAFTQERLNTLFTNQRFSPLPEDRHITDQYLRVASAPFALDFSRMRLAADVVTTPEDAAAVSGMITRSNSAAPVFLLHGGTTWQTKFWYQDGWVALGRLLLADYPDGLLLFSWGNDKERAAAEQCAKALGSRAMLLERLPLPRLAALVKQVDLVIGGDTGIVHLAAATGTRTVSYYRSSDGMRSGPRGPGHQVVQAPMPCAGCFRTGCDRDDECRISITPEMLQAAVNKVMPCAGAAPAFSNK